MGDTHTYKCPQCGGNLVYSAEEQALLCSFCGNAITPEKLELLSKIDIPDQGEADESEDRQEILCNSCGAAIIADKSASATFCAFCGSPSLITQRLTKRFRPDYVIPFKITKEEALSKIKEFAKHGKYAPKHFFVDKNITKITGIFVPFWLMNTRCCMDVKGVGYIEDLKTTRKYSVVSYIDIGVKNVPFDGAINMRDQLMESIEPYDCSELVDYNGSYLQGYYAQRYDLSVQTLTDRIMTRLKRYSKEAAVESLKGYSRFDFLSSTVGIGELEQKYALFPVWLLTYEYGGLKYQIAVNGQTGKTDGYLPVDKVKKYLRLIRYNLVNILILSSVSIVLAAIVLLWKMWAQSNPGMAVTYNIIAALSVSLSSLIILVYLDARHDDESGYGKYNIFHPLRRALSSLFDHRLEVREKLLDETDMMIGDKPPFSEYYDDSSKADITTDELFMGNESIFEDERI